MKIDTLQKQQAILQFFQQLKSSKDIGPFLFNTDKQFSFEERQHITLLDIQLRLMKGSYYQLEDFISELTSVFRQVCDTTIPSSSVHLCSNRYLLQINSFLQQFRARFDQSPLLQPSSLPYDSYPELTITPLKEQSTEGSISSTIIWNNREDKYGHKSQRSKQVIGTYGMGSTLSQKLDMVFLLQSHGNNEGYLKSVASCLRCGQDYEDELVIDVSDRNPYWRCLLLPP